MTIFLQKEGFYNIVNRKETYVVEPRQMGEGHVN